MSDETGGRPEAVAHLTQGQLWGNISISCTASQMLLPRQVIFFDLSVQ